MTLPATATARALTALGAAWAVSLAVHPSVYGALSTLRWFALIALVPALATAMRSKPRLTATVLGGAAVAEALIVIGQSLRGRALGLGFLGEPARPFIESQQVLLAPTGTINHPDLHGWFLLAITAALILVTLRRELATPLTAAVCFLGTSAATVSYKRMPMLGWIAIGATLLVIAVRQPGHERRVSLTLAGSLALGVAAFLPSTFHGWYYRAEAGAASVSDFSSGRVDLIPQAGEIIAANPAGVGPNNYLPELVRRHPGITRPTLVHVVPLLATAEGGWAVGASLVALGLIGAIDTLAAWRRRRRRWTHVALGAAPLTIVAMLTPLPMLYAIGPVLTALGLATCAVALTTDDGEPARIGRFSSHTEQERPFLDERAHASIR